jgi:hypothetical protein
VGQATELAKEFVPMQASLEKELMYVVAVMTTRSDNFLEMAQTDHISSDKYRTLQEIVF